MKHYITLVFILMLTIHVEATSVLNNSLYDLKNFQENASDDEKKELIRTKKAELVEAAINNKQARKMELQTFIDSKNTKRERVKLAMEISTKIPSLPRDICLALAKHFLNVARYTIGNTLQRIGSDFIALPAQTLLTNATQWIETNQTISKEKRERHINNQIEEIFHIQAHETEIKSINAQIDRLNNICKRDDIFDLECRYILKKDKIPEPWQEYIEETFIMALEDNWEDSDVQCLKYISSYPTHTKTLYEGIKDLFVSKPSFAKAFHEGKQYLEAIFNYDLQMPEKHQKNWINIFKKIARAAEDKDRYFAYCQTEDTNTFRIAARYIAKLISVPFKVIDAKKYKISFEYLFGSKDDGAMITHLFFSKKDNETYLNPILFIQNFDQCAHAENIPPWLLKLFDNEEKTYNDACLGLKIDMSQLSIIVSGTTPYEDLETGIRDRFEKISF